MADETTILLPITYLGPIQLYSKYYCGKQILIEQYDTYLKQTYRNRCDIYGANGRLSLIIPIKHESGKRPKTKDVKIDYDTDWRRLHWKGIESAYNSSPFFEFYKDVFEPYYSKKHVFLIDLCLSLNDKVLKILNLPVKPLLTDGFVFPGSRLDVLDLRSAISPKHTCTTDKGFRSAEYPQVFQNAHGFLPDLSILDLIFNLGPECGVFLKSSLI